MTATCLRRLKTAPAVVYRGGDAQGGEAHRVRPLLVADDVCQRRERELSHRHRVEKCDHGREDVARGSKSFCEGGDGVRECEAGGCLGRAIG